MTLRFSLAPSDLALLDAAVADAGARCARVTARLPATPARAFEVMADQSTWAAWCADCKGAAWIPAADGAVVAGGVGAVRLARFSLASFEERILAWEPGARFAFSIDACTLPIARRAAEDWRLRPLDDGACELAWTLAVDVAPLARPLWPASRALAERALARTAAGLARVLR